MMEAKEMKNKDKVVHLRPKQDEIRGRIIPGSIALLHVDYEMNDEDEESDFLAAMPECTMEIAILGHVGDGDLASYQATVEVIGKGSIDADQLGKDTSFPVISEFSLLISLLSRASTGLPYVVGPAELLGLLGDDELF